MTQACRLAVGWAGPCLCLELQGNWSLRSDPHRGSWEGGRLHLLKGPGFVFSDISVQEPVLRQRMSGIARQRKLQLWTFSITKLVYFLPMCITMATPAVNLPALGQVKFPYKLSLVMWTSPILQEGPHIQSSTVIIELIISIRVFVRCYCNLSCFIV